MSNTCMTPAVALSVAGSTAPEDFTTRMDVTLVLLDNQRSVAQGHWSLRSTIGSAAKLTVKGNHFRPLQGRMKPDRRPAYALFQDGRCQIAPIGFEAPPYKWAGLFYGLKSYRPDPFVNAKLGCVEMHNRRCRAKPSPDSTSRGRLSCAAAEPRPASLDARRPG
jgi:hypothetical protein